MNPSSHPPAPIRNRVGPPVRGEDFLERDAETRELWHLATRGHVLMLAPRRVGKTSLLLHMVDKPQDGWSCLFLSAESLSTEAQFVARLVSVIAKNSPDVLRDFSYLSDLNEHDLVREFKEDWRNVGASVARALREQGRKFAVLIDEFGIFASNLLTPGAGPTSHFNRWFLFLHWFRDIRNALQGSADGSVHFVLASSMELGVLMRATGMSAALNDLAIYRLGPFTGDQADLLLQRLGDGEGLPLNHALRKKILAYLDWPIPYHVQLMFGEVLRRVRYQGRHLDSKLIDEAYSSLLSREKMFHFNHWLERLDSSENGEIEKDLKIALLGLAARNADGLDWKSAARIAKRAAPGLDLRTVLSSLEDEGYLTLQGDRWRFASSLLRDWWLTWVIKAPPQERKVPKVVSPEGALPREQVRDAVRAIHVLPGSAGGWEVRRIGQRRMVRHFDTKEAAVSFGEKLARDRGSDLRVHPRAGQSLAIAG